MLAVLLLAQMLGKNFVTVCYYCGSMTEEFREVFGKRGIQLHGLKLDEVRRLQCGHAHMVISLQAHKLTRRYRASRLKGSIALPDASAWLNGLMLYKDGVTYAGPDSEIGRQTDMVYRETETERQTGPGPSPGTQGPGKGGPRKRLGISKSSRSDT